MTSARRKRAGRNKNRRKPSPEELAERRARRLTCARCCIEQEPEEYSECRKRRRLTPAKSDGNMVCNTCEELAQLAVRFKPSDRQILSDAQIAALVELQYATSAIATVAALARDRLAPQLLHVLKQCEVTGNTRDRLTVLGLMTRCIECLPNLATYDEQIREILGEDYPEEPPIADEKEPER